MSESRLRWRYSVLSALTLFTLFLLFSSSASRFKLAQWSEDTNIDLSGQFEYQPTVVAGAPVQVPTPSSDSTTLQHGSPSPNPNVTGPGKPPQKLVGMVFAGRKEYVSILDCYLQ